MLSEGVNFYPFKRKLVWYLDKLLLVKLIFFGLTISLLSLHLTFLLLLYLPFFHFISFTGSIYFFFINYERFCCSLLILLFLCLCSLLPHSIEMGCSLKKNSFYHYLVFQRWFSFCARCSAIYRGQNFY